MSHNHALGPQVGVFDQRAAELLTDHVDAMGFDSIQSGGTLAWIMELVADGVIDPAEYGFPPASTMKFHFEADPDRFDVVQDSMLNALYAIELINVILFEARAEIFRSGIRAAAIALDKQKGTRSIDRAVYIAHGEQGCMVPNQYWVPGMLSPMPMMGKYFVYYGVDFLAPEVLGRKNVERMTYELFNENSGICRFHRKWSEFITDEILQAHYGLKVDYKAHQFQLSREIYEREAPKIIFWESERVIDMIMGYLVQWEVDGLHTPELEHWLGRFRQDKKAAAKEYWQAMRMGIKSGFAEGADVIPNNFTPGQQGSLPKPVSTG